VKVALAVQIQGEGGRQKVLPLSSFGQLLAESYSSQVQHWAGVPEVSVQVPLKVRQEVS
jgi:hypothetical protein